MDWARLDFSQKLKQLIYYLLNYSNQHRNFSEKSSILIFINDSSIHQKQGLIRTLKKYFDKILWLRIVRIDFVRLCSSQIFDGQRSEALRTHQRRLLSPPNEHGFDEAQLGKLERKI